MKLKNGQLIIYEVNREYIDFLSKYDKNVRLKSDRRYTGILIRENNIDYCVPLTCKVKKRSTSLTLNIKDKERVISQLTINNMIPVREALIQKVDVRNDKDKDYLNKEIVFLRKKENIKSLLEKAENIMNVLHNKESFDYDFFKKLCADFDLLEEKMREYIKKIK